MRLMTTLTMLLAMAAGPTWGMQILVRMSDGRTIALDVDPSNAVETVRRAIRDRDGAAPGEHALFVDGARMEDGRRLSEYGIDRTSVLHWLPRGLGHADRSGAGGAAYSLALEF
jgi:hypothetical protein